MKEFILTEKKSENAVLVGLITPQQNEQKTQEYLDELAFLAETAGAVPVRRFVQRLDAPNSVSYVGPGKLQEIKQYCEDSEVGMVIFDDDLGPKQLQHIEKQLGRKILDRTSLILDIFASRAQTATAKTQVELAQYQYLLPRLAGLWTHLERQKGGIGMRGPGETQIETDRRIVQDRIALLKQQLAHIDRQMSTQRKNRGKLVRVALVGYTNVGKSTLMNVLSKSDVFAENKLFATLDTTVRKVIIDNLPFLMSDTVGFIRKLPTHLVESFKSTLDEVREADILVHVVDISHPTFEDQIRVVEQTLGEVCRPDMGALASAPTDAADLLHDDGYRKRDKRRRRAEASDHGKPTLLVFNKIDAVPAADSDAQTDGASADAFPDELSDAARRPTLDDLRRTWMARMQDNCLFISARSGQGIDQLKTRLYDMVRDIHTRRFPYNDFLFQKYDEELDPQ